MSELEYISWETFGNLCDNVVKQILVSSFIPEIIVGIQRGGLVPSVYISHSLNIGYFLSFPIRRTVTDLPLSEKGEPLIGNFDGKLLTEKRVLLIDDIISSGVTFSSVLQAMKPFNFLECKTAALIQKTTNVELDFVAYTSNKWVVFPWETT